LIFQKAEVLPEENGVQKVAFTLTAPNGNTITHLFSLAPKQYNIDWTIQLNGADQLLTNHQLNVLWEAHTFKQERTLNYERQMSNICFQKAKNLIISLAKQLRHLKSQFNGWAWYNSSLILH